MKTFRFHYHGWGGRIRQDARLRAGSHRQGEERTEEDADKHLTNHNKKHYEQTKTKENRRCAEYAHCNAG